MLKNDFENQNFVIFEELLNNFGRSDNDTNGIEKSMVSTWHLVLLWFHVQLAQKILNGSYCHCHCQAASEA